MSVVGSHLRGRFGYARNQRAALRRFLDGGRLPMHDNISELNLRRGVVGRKNWLFVGSDDGGDVNATFVSLLASCGLHKVEPFAYMRDLLCLLPRWPSHRVLDLAPAYWGQTLEKREAQQALDANVFRRVVLGLAGGASHRPRQLPASVAKDMVARTSARRTWGTGVHWRGIGAGGEALTHGDFGPCPHCPQHLAASIEIHVTEPSRSA